MTNVYNDLLIKINEEQIYLIIFDYPNIYYIIFYKVVKA